MNVDKKTFFYLLEQLYALKRLSVLGIVGIVKIPIWDWEAVNDLQFITIMTNGTVQTQLSDIDIKWLNFGYNKLLSITIEIARIENILK